MLIVGRQDEQARFAALLSELSQAAKGRPGSPSPVVLVLGPSGVGKSLLLRRFAEQAAAAGVRAARIDWEDEKERTPVRYAGATGPGVLTVLGVVQHSIISTFSEKQLATGRVAEAFRPYNEGARRMGEYVARVQEAIALAGRSGSPVTREDGVALRRSVVLAGLATVWQEPGQRKPRPDESEEPTRPLSAAAVGAVIRRKPKELSPAEYALVNDPATELTRRFADSLAIIAHRQPMVVFLDGGQELGDRAWGWLRLVMNRTARRVAWVIAADREITGFDSGPVTRLAIAGFDDATARAYLESQRIPAAADRDLITGVTGGLPLALAFAVPLLQRGLTIDDAGPAAAVIPRLAEHYLEQAESEDSGDAARIRALALGYGSLRDDEDILAVLWRTSKPQPIFGELASRCEFVIPAIRQLHPTVKAALRTAMLSQDRRNSVRPVNERALNWYLARLAAERRRQRTLDEQLGQASFASALLGALWHATWVSSQEGLEFLATVLPVLAVAQVHLADVAAGLMDQFIPAFTPDQQLYLDQLTVREDGPPGASAKRRVLITEAGLGFPPRFAEDGRPLIGQPGDREAAVLTLRAQLLAKDEQYAATVANLREAASMTKSRALGQVIGTQALAVTHRLTWPDSRRRAVPDEAGLAAATIAAELLPGQAAAWTCLGGASLAAGRLDEAVAAYQRALELRPSDAMTATNLGSALRLLGRFDDSLAACERALAADRTNSYFHANRIVTLGVLGRRDEALAAADEALALLPDAVEPRTIRGTVLMTMGRYADALTEYDQALTLDQDDPAPHLNKGIALAVTGEFDQALTELETAGRLDRTSLSEGSAWAGAIYWHRGDAEAARKQFAQVNSQFIRRTPFRAAELEAIARCGLGHPASAEQHLLAAFPSRSPGDRAEPRAIYDLLAAPPLPGIDRLRAITDRP